MSGKRGQRRAEGGIRLAPQLYIVLRYTANAGWIGHDTISGMKGHFVGLPRHWRVPLSDPRFLHSSSKW